MAPDIELLRQFLAYWGDRSPPPLLAVGLAQNTPPSYAELAAVLSDADKHELAVRILAFSSTGDGFTIEDPELFSADVWMSAIKTATDRGLIPRPALAVKPLLDERNGMVNRLPSAVRGAPLKIVADVRALIANAKSPVRSASFVMIQESPDVSRFLKKLSGRCVAVDRVGSLDLLCACAVARVRYVASSLLDGARVAELRRYANTLGLDYDILGDEAALILVNPLI